MIMMTKNPDIWKLGNSPNLVPLMKKDDENKNKNGYFE